MFDADLLNTFICSNDHESARHDSQPMVITTLSALPALRFILALHDEGFTLQESPFAFSCLFSKILYHSKTYAHNFGKTPSQALEMLQQVYGDNANWTKISSLFVTHCS